MGNDNKYFRVDINFSISNRSTCKRLSLKGLVHITIFLQMSKSHHRHRHFDSKYKNIRENTGKIVCLECRLCGICVWLIELFKIMNPNSLSHLMFDVWYEFFNLIFN